MTPRALNADGGLSEAAWQAQVVGLARLYDWRVYHPPDNRPDRDRPGRAGRQHVTPGYPDLTLVRGADLIFAELKAERGRVTADQGEWLMALEDAGAETHVWRPSDFDDVNRRLARSRTLLEPAASRT